jgi:hypothetical protein
MLRSLAPQSKTQVMKAKSATESPSFHVSATGGRDILMLWAITHLFPSTCISKAGDLMFLPEAGHVIA